MSEGSRNELLWQARKESDFFVAFVADEVVTGDFLEELPDHLTLYSKFRTMGCKAVNGFVEALRDAESISAHIGEREFGPHEYFGEPNDVLVRPIVGEGALSLMAIHVLLLARFRPYTYDLRWSGQHYRPHMSIQSSDRDPCEGSSICVDSACLIQKPEEGGYIIYSADKF